MCTKCAQKCCKWAVLDARELDAVRLGAAGRLAAAMDLERLIAALAPVGRRWDALRSRSPTSPTTPARSAPGSLFFCVPGARADGHDFAAEAVANGAVALVVERPLDLAVPQLVVADARARRWPSRPTSSSADPTRELAGRRRHRHERQDDDDVPALRDPRRGRPSARACSARSRRRVGGERRPGRPHDARGDRPPAHVPRDARRRRPQLRDRGDLARLGARPARPRPLRGARLHEPDARTTSTSTGRWSAYFEAKRRLFVGGAAAGGGQRRRRVRAAARRRAARRDGCSPSASRTTPTFAPTASSSARAARASRRRHRARDALRGRFNVENVLGAVAAARLLGSRTSAIARGVERAARRARPLRARSTRGSRSRSSSTTRTRPTRSRTCSARRASWRTAA